MTADEGQTRAVGQVGLVALFVTALVTAQLTASKVLAFAIPVSVPLLPSMPEGSLLLLPGASVAYAVTFFASDCYAELYGKRAAQVVVNVAFAMNFVVLFLVWTTIAAPAARNSPVGAETFAAALGPTLNVVLGSLVAYLVSQNWDVIVFHRIREYTDGEALWLRNVGSTATSQAIDTVLFVVIAFLVAPAVLGIGNALPVNAVVGLALGQYLLKLGIVVLDTPFVYLVVGALRSKGSQPGPEVA